MSTMFGFLFRKSKNGDKDNSHKHSRDARRLSKEVQLSEKDKELKHTPAPGPNDPLTFHQNSLNCVSVSIDSLYPPGSDSGNYSVEYSSTGSLASPSPGTNCENCDDGSIKILREESIGFIDDIQTDSDGVQELPGGGDSDTCPDTKRHLNEAERKAMVQLEAIRSKLISKETELSLLQADINMMAVDRDNKAMEIQSLSSQLNALKSENELSLKRIHTFEAQLEELRTKNSQLSEELFKKCEQLKCLQADNLSKPNNVSGDLSVKIKDLEDKIKELESEKNKLLSHRDLIEKEKEGQIKAIQDALEDALEAKIKLQNKYEKELRDVRESNSSLVDDFEWKLHQVEASCKKKLQEKDRQIEEKVKQGIQSSSTDITAEKEKLEEERKAVYQQLRQVEHLKAYEVEVTQLRGVTSEQQKSLRAASRQLEQLKFNEKVLQSEITSLKTLLDQEKTHCQVISNSHQRRLESQEQGMVDKLEKQKRELNTEWEGKLKQECSRLKEDLRKMHLEENRVAIESLKKKECELTSQKLKLESCHQELADEVSKLKEEIKAKESSFQKEIAKATTIVDRDNWELRRKMDKLSDSHLEEIDALKESHSEEMDLLTQRYENALCQLEKLQKKVEEFEKTSRSTDSVETEKDSGIAADGSSQSIVDHTANDDSECSSESESEVSEGEEESYEEEEEDVETQSTKKEGNGTRIHELREEVATLQDSIETLTLNLVKNEATTNKTFGLRDTPKLVTELEEGDTSSSQKSSSVVSSDTENESDENSEDSSKH